MPKLQFREKNLMKRDKILHQTFPFHRMEKNDIKVLNMKNPLVSVIIPVYNVERYLEECLDSVFNQTYKHIEVIAINDGSTDNSLNILNEYSKKHSNLKVINQENQGQAAARNKGISEASGEYVHFLDSDDYLAPDTFENLILKMGKNNLDLIRFAAEPFADGIDYEVIPNQYDFSKYYHDEKVYEKEEFLDSLQQTLLQREFSASPCLFVVKRKVLVENKITFDTSGVKYEDELFTLEVFLNSNRVMYDPGFYYKRRFRANSLMTTVNDVTSFDSYAYVITELGKLLKKYQMPEEKKVIKKRIRKLYGIAISMDVEREKKKQLARIDSISLWDKILFAMMYNTKKLLKS